MPKLSRRKYQELIHFWKSTITNPKVSIRVRMSAAQRLDDTYRRHEFYEQQAESRKDRAEARALGSAIPPQESLSETQETGGQVSEDERLASIFGSILNGKSGVGAHDTE